MVSGESSRKPLFQNQCHGFFHVLAVAQRGPPALKPVSLSTRQSPPLPRSLDHSSQICFAFTKTKQTQSLPSYLKSLNPSALQRKQKDFLISRLTEMPAMCSHRRPAPEAEGRRAVSLAPQLIYNSILFCAQSQTLSNSSDPSFRPRAVQCLGLRHSLSSEAHTETKTEQNQGQRLTTSLHWSWTEEVDF